MTTDGADEPGSPPGRRRRPLWQEALGILVIAVAVAVLVKTLLLQAFYLPSESMEPGLVRNDRILVEKISYGLGVSPERGDVVVFEDPGGWLPPEEVTGPRGTVPRLMEKVGLYPSGGHLVKRVIGVAGDTIHCCDEQGRLLVNNFPLDEGDYAWDDGAECFGPMIGCDWTVGPIPDGSIFVMGDNRWHSADSSFHHCEQKSGCPSPGDEYVPVDLVVGQVFVLLWPLGHFSWLHRPDVFDHVPAAPVG